MSKARIYISDDVPEQDAIRLRNALQRVASSPLPLEERKKKIAEMQNLYNPALPEDRKTELFREWDAFGEAANKNIGGGTSFLTGFTQGATLDWGDEIAAGISSVLRGRDYGDEKARAQAMFDRAQSNAAPYWLGYTAGALAPAVLGAGVSVPATLAAKFPRLAGFASRVLPLRQAPPASGLASLAQGAKTGAAVGAVSGAGQARDIYEVPAGVAGGGAIGGALGGAIGGTLAAARGVFDRLGPGAAERSMARALGQTGLSPAEIQRVLAEARAAGQPMRLGDIGGAAAPPARVTDAAMQISSDRLHDAAQFLGQRLEGAAERIATKLQQVLGRAPDSVLAKNVIQEEIETALQPAVFFQRFLERGLVIKDPAFLGFFERPIVGNALKAAANSMRNAGRTPGVLYDKAGKIEGVTLETFDYVRKALGDALYSGVDPRNTSRALLKSDIATGREVLKQMSDTVRAAAPEYAAALDGYSAAFKLRDAVTRGENAARKAGNAALNDIAGLQTDTERKAFAVGFFSAKLQGASNPARALAGDAQRRELTEAVLRSAIGADEASAAARFLDRERLMGETARMWLGGSPTARRLAGIVDEGMSLPLDPSNPISSAWKYAMNELGKRKAGGLLDVAVLADADAALPRIAKAARTNATLDRAQVLAPHLGARYGVKIIGGWGR